MGVLRARVSGAWVDVGIAGGPLPPGGATGEILVKITATDGDALWRTALPKLELTSTANLTNLTQSDTALLLGASSAANLIFDRNSVQARNNGATATFYVNPLGGTVDLSAVSGLVEVGSASTPGVSAIGLRVNAPASGTTKRASVRIGNWAFHQDVAANGTTDFVLYETTAGVVHSYHQAGKMTNFHGEVIIGRHPTHLAAGMWKASSGFAPGTAYMMLFFGANLLWNSDGGDIELRIDNAAKLTVNRANNRINIDAANGIYFPAGNGGWYMSDTTYIRAHGNKTIYTGGNILAGGNIDAQANMTVAGSISANSNIYGDRPAAAGTSTWGYMQFIARSNAAGTTGVAGISFNPANAGVAPIMRCYGNTGEGFHFRSNPDTAYIGLNASAFAVGSSVRTKQDIEELDDKIVMDLARQVQPIRFRYRERPQTLRTEVENPEIEDWVSYDHDCSIDNCDGNADDPCCITLNYTPRFGFTAEDMALIMPEMVELDEYRLPSGIDTAQVASVALAGVGALVRRIEELEREVDGLRN